MDNMEFFNSGSKAAKVGLGIFLIFCIFCWAAILANQEMDAFARTVAISIASWAALFSLHSLLRVNKFSFDKASNSIRNARGYFFLKNEYVYSAANIKSIELRVASDYAGGVNGVAKTSRTLYCAVLVLDGDELYVGGSADFEEARLQVKELSKALAVNYKVDLERKSKSKGHEANIFRILVLLFGVLLVMFPLFKFFVAQGFK